LIYSKQVRFLAFWKKAIECYWSLDSISASMHAIDCVKRVQGSVIIDCEDKHYNTVSA